MNVDLHALRGHLAALSRVTMRSFNLTVLVTAFAGAVLASLSYYVLREHSPVAGAFATILALAEALAAGVILGIKRAAGSAVVYAFGTLRVGRTLVRAIFERILGVGGVGGNVVVVQHLGPVSPEEADQLLNRAVRSVGADEHGGWVRRATQGRLLGSVREYAMQRIRVGGSGAVDLLKIKETLEQSVDDGVIGKVRREIRMATTLVVVFLPLLVAAQTWLMLLLLRPN